MTAMTVQAFALLVASPVCNPAHLPMEALQGHAVVESGLDASIMHVNTNHTVDYGLFQINSTNLARLGLTTLTALDPCRNMAAAEAVLFSTYNSGRPTASIPYAMNVMTAIAKVSATPSMPSMPPPTPRAQIHLHDQIASFSH
jgi:hypothetical protein